MIDDYGQTLVTACEDCGKDYDDNWLDVTLPNDQWRAITGHDNEMETLLCGSCMIERGRKLSGVVAARLLFDFGPADASEDD